MYNVNREDLAWAAGFMEGEGSFVCGIKSVGNWRPYAHLHVTASQVQKEPLDHLSNILPFGQVRGPYAAKGGKQPIHRWDVTGFERSQAVCAMLWPWLSPRRKDQIRKALETFHSMYRSTYDRSEASKKGHATRRHNGTPYKHKPHDRFEASRKGWITRRHNLVIQAASKTAALGGGVKQSLHLTPSNPLL